MLKQCCPGLHPSPKRAKAGIRKSDTVQSLRRLQTSWNWWTKRSLTGQRWIGFEYGFWKKTLGDVTRKDWSMLKSSPRILQIAQSNSPAMCFFQVLTQLAWGHLHVPCWCWTTRAAIPCIWRRREASHRQGWASKISQLWSWPFFEVPDRVFHSHGGTPSGWFFDGKKTFWNGWFGHLFQETLIWFHIELQDIAGYCRSANLPQLWEERCNSAPSPQLLWCSLQLAIQFLRLNPFLWNLNDPAIGQQLPGHNSAGQVHAPKVGVQCPVLPVMARRIQQKGIVGIFSAGDPKSYHMNLRIISEMFEIYLSWDILTYLWHRRSVLQIGPGAPTTTARCGRRQSLEVGLGSETLGRRQVRRPDVGVKIWDSCKKVSEGTQVAPQIIT